jgi:glutamate dehydrogenase
MSELDPRSHAGRVLINILETMPRDDLIQGSSEELLQITQGIRYLQDRKQTQLFVRHDVYNRFLSCLVYIPKEIYNSSFRQAIETIFFKHLEISSIDFSTMFTESILARIHFMIHLKKDVARPSDELIAKIEHESIHAGRTWHDDLSIHLIEAYGEEQGNSLFERYQNAFTNAYTSNNGTRYAVTDIHYLEELYKSKQMKVKFFKSLDDELGHFRIKLFQIKNTIALSDVLPIIENFGLRATVERPYFVKPDHQEEGSWINEFLMTYPLARELDLEDIKDNFQESFLKIWLGEIENDKFNKLILAANLKYRHIIMLRAYARYLKQIGIPFSQEYIELALLHQASITQKLVQLFEYRFIPNFSGNREEKVQALRQELLHDLELVSNLDEDRIIRLYIDLILNTLRTNFYQVNKEGDYKPYLSFKFDSKNIPRMPKPYPKYEIFVYSPRFEAIHLRCGDVSRGGLRWSDRKEDFRTEVLGLMKAQQVKNSVIVPNGAKGGFVPKLLDNFTNRDDYQAEAVACYQQFIRGLLDITDNYVAGEIVRPGSVVSYDPPDPYLVVAADKGTASFSDYSNAISKEYNFWLGDAFASGGSNGYDHKKMGITARGAWESVRRHFYYLGKDIQTTSFTVIGVGDMAGDVFGNGMLLSKHIRLVAAFNHQHIFLDPHPEETLSYGERERLFKLPRSTWMDYNLDLISKGGGVYHRNAKYIDISPEVKERFLIADDRLEPNELIKAILRAPVELLWSAGIGTFVKGEKETNQSVGDRSNDLIRLNASELRCQVVGEGGNLGFTQNARIEYALAGGRIYTDFIDNSGGVSCSDKEVNIKILLDLLVKNGDLTIKQREELLLNMTQDVSKLVLSENNAQTKAISLWAAQSKRSIDLHIRYIHHLETVGKLDRALEFLPTEQEMLERKQQNIGLTIPEISVLYCYSKILIKEDLLKSNVPEEPFFFPLLVKYFPVQLRELYVKEMQEHPLKREILATTISNMIVNEMGFFFVYRMQDETGAPVSVIVSAFMIARSILKMDEVWSNLHALQNSVDADFMDSIIMLYVRLLRRMTRWLLCSQRRRLDIVASIDKYQTAFQTFQANIETPYNHGVLQYSEHRLEDLIERGFSHSSAQNILKIYSMFALFDIVEISLAKNISLETAASAYFIVGNFLDLNFIRFHVIQHENQDHWEFLAKESVRDELDKQQRQLTETVLIDGDTLLQFEKRLQEWSVQHHSLIERWHQLLNQLKTVSHINFTMYYVAMRELLDLTQTALQHCADGEICDFF